MDLVGRKLAMDGGKHWKSLLKEIREFNAALPASEEFAIIKTSLENLVDHSEECANWLAAEFKQNPSNALCGSVPFLRLLSTTIGCYLMAKGALCARNRLDNGDEDKDFLNSKIVTSRYYAQQIAPTVLNLKPSIMSGDELFFAINEEYMAFL
jgi:acyl-CoA dehydrogenase